MRKGWELKKINDVCEIGDGNHGGNYPKKSDMRDFGVPFIRSVNLVNGEVSDEDLKYISEEKHKSLNKGHLKTGDVLFTNRGDIGKCAIVGSEFDDANLNSQIAFFRCSSSLYNRYLYYFLLSPNLQNYLYASKTGSALQQFPIGLIVKIEIPIPPLPEQQRIVSVLDEALASIAQAKSNAERNLVNARELFESVLESFFEDPQHTPDGKELESLCELIVDCEHKTAPIQDEGYPSIRTPNIGRGYLILEGVNRVSEETYIRWTRRAIPQGGDLILAREAPAGNVAVIPDGLEVCLGQRTVLIRPNNKIFNSQYLMWLLLSGNVQKFFLQNSKGSTVVHVNMKDIRGLKINNIPPLAEQRAIVGRLEALSAETGRLEEIYQEKVESLEELKKSVLGKAFAGEL